MNWQNKTSNKMSKKNKTMNNWETEFEVKYERIYLDNNGSEVTKKDNLIIEASTQSEVINIIKQRFDYSDTIKIESIKELWKY
tara:strand:+ start:139 stop:387 length:249 start_codon:yes stop_codon:yes gene_type:complete